MEDANKAIDISVGVIIFIIALSVNVFLYASINKSIQEVLSINNIDSSIIVTNEDINNEYVEYTKGEIFYMIQDMIVKTDKTSGRYIADEYSPYNSDIKVELWKSTNTSATKLWSTLTAFINDMYVASTGKVTTAFNTYFEEGKYKVEYTYEYVELDKLNLSNHKITKIKFTKI